MPTRADTALSRVNASGVGAASPQDLLAIGLSRRAQDVEGAEKAAIEILKKYRGIHRIGELDSEELRNEAGLEDFEILRARALIELGKRAEKTGPGDPEEINGPEDVERILSHLTTEKKEHFCLILMDSQNRVMRWTTIHIGTLTMSVVGPREVFREAVREAASAIIVAHNHPSGDPTPSPEDVEVTGKLAEIGKMLDIPLLDHVIIGSRGKSVSLKRRGHIQ